jgi:hypothetical protein
MVQENRRWSTFAIDALEPPRSRVDSSTLHDLTRGRGPSSAALRTALDKKVEEVWFPSWPRRHATSPRLGTERNAAQRLLCLLEGLGNLFSPSSIAISLIGGNLGSWCIQTSEIESQEARDHRDTILSQEPSVAWCACFHKLLVRLQSWKLLAASAKW